VWPGLTTDQLGDYSSVSIDPSLYSEAAVYKTAYWFTDRYYVFLDRTAEGRIVVELRAKEANGGDLKAACAEFCNSLIDFRVRNIVAQETMPIREALVTKAFMEGVPQAGLAGAKSSERISPKKIADVGV
jgi:His-Xaa-Ser system protein HxsD